ncbi:6-phosphofructo-2-kinase [Saitoella complicata NRRL Y-17804]|nr:6-phosphofructo-2-kinase [Saitoella complicata NRRL Y-17804]ODQ51900.1 6-phosphofructo-2-kinase [Saitoella complicata NRRL Y-17804]
MVHSKPEVFPVANTGSPKFVPQMDQQQQPEKLGSSGPGRKGSLTLDVLESNNYHRMETHVGQSPAQLYLTESGRLFHAGKIAIVFVGLPARGKTHLAVSLARYLNWLGVNTRTFHLGDYRRAFVADKDLPEDYWILDASEPTKELRAKILENCRDDLIRWYDEEKGQVAIYDAVNPIASKRRELKDMFARHDIQTLYIESFCDDPKIIEANVHSVKISSPDYVGWDPREAVKDYLRRIDAKIPHFESIEDRDLDYVKVINVGEKIIVNNARFGYLSSRIVFYLTNLHIKRRVFYLARAGNSIDEGSYRLDSELDDEGRSYAESLTRTVLKRRESELKQRREKGDMSPENSLIVWTSTRARTVQTASGFKEAGFTVRERPQLSQRNPGVCEGKSAEEIRKMYPDICAALDQDPYHTRFPRAESYHDVALRTSDVLLEMERQRGDLLIIAHESVLRCLYAYFRGTPADEIPFLSFRRNELVEVLPGSYNCAEVRITIEGWK